MRGLWTCAIVLALVPAPAAGRADDREHALELTKKATGHFRLNTTPRSGGIPTGATAAQSRA
jgi:hypothetical protein